MREVNEFQVDDCVMMETHGRLHDSYDQHCHIMVVTAIVVEFPLSDNGLGMPSYLISKETHHSLHIRSTSAVAFDMPLSR